MIWTTKVATTETEGRWISEKMGGYLKKWIINFSELNMQILTLTPRQVNEIHEYQRLKKILNVFNEKTNNLHRKRNPTSGFKRKHHIQEEMNFYLRTLNFNFISQTIIQIWRRNKNCMRHIRLQEIGQRYSLHSLKIISEEVKKI